MRRRSSRASENRSGRDHYKFAIEARAVWIAAKLWLRVRWHPRMDLMQKPPLDPDVDDSAPDETTLTTYDEQHIITYLRLLDADAAGADWRRVAKIVLHIDPDHEPDRARHAFETHLARAKWMTEHGYRHLLRGGASC